MSRIVVQSVPVWVCLGALLGVFAMSEASANVCPRYSHDHLNVFPAAKIAAGDKGIAVDGDLSDWKDEAFMPLYGEPNYIDTHSIRLALAYDADGLLVAAKVSDLTPMSNLVDPQTSPQMGWNGDAVQIRFAAGSDLKTPLPPAELEGERLSVQRQLFFGVSDN